MKIPRPASPAAYPTGPGRGVAPAPVEETVAIADLGKVPKSKMGFAQFAYSRTNAIVSRLAGIHQELRRSQFETYKRVEVNAQKTGTGDQTLTVPGPSAGTVWAVHRVVLAIQGDPADLPTVLGFPGLYRKRGDGNDPTIDALFLPLFIPSLIGSSLVTSGVVYDMARPAVYRGIEDLTFLMDVGGTITAPYSVYLGLDVEVMPEAPTVLEIT